MDGASRIALENPESESGMLLITSCPKKCSGAGDLTLPASSPGPYGPINDVQSTPKMEGAGGTAPPSEGSKPSVLLLNDTPILRLDKIFCYLNPFFRISAHIFPFDTKDIPPLFSEEFIFLNVSLLL